MTSPTEIRISDECCSVCLWPFIVTLGNNELAVRCPRCGASAITQSLVAVLRSEFSDWQARDVYEMSSSGPLLKFLRQSARSVTVSEFFDDVAPGDYKGAIQCQNVQSLTFPDAVFDLCTSTEVFEHVRNDLAGFAEVHRVLKPGGAIVFTVPLSRDRPTVERVVYTGTEAHYVLPPVYHGDRMRGDRVLCMRDYGADILDRLTSVGFERAAFVAPEARLFGYSRPIVIARRPQST